MKPYWICDIETSGLPEALQREIMPLEWPLGNLKDPEKVKAAIAEKERSWLDSAALDACRGQVLAIGLAGADMPEPKILVGGTERGMLTNVRDLATVYNDLIMVGHNLLGFDLPFLVRRMWKHGIQPPSRWLDLTQWRAKWAFDTMLAWSLGNREQRISLDLLAWVLLGKRKSGSGADFAMLYETDREKALTYLRNDLELTEQCYLAMTK